ncbi:hydroxyproline dehydrogenase isoform X3 [Ornithorhynchus anatinus]|uniref:hydroxyproline dehydrogenase isoform X3 n=1 Tax=Ornithorhynchus anatinus TaxID=9258 RepID=UPI0019D4B5AC|nr:hydroxyproline dehydrogenase isoform X3 [Ornithorhynchus anatinus]
MLRASQALRARAPSPSGGPSPGVPSPTLRFDGEVFRLKGTGELVRALMVLRLCAWPPLVTHSLEVLSWCRRLLGSRLSGAVLRASVYGQFVAGETAEEVQSSVRRLQALGLRPLLAVPTEEEPGTERGGEGWYEGNLSAMLSCVDLSSPPADPAAPSPALMQLKVTALTSTRLCKELTALLGAPGGTRELSPDSLAAIMESGQDPHISSLSSQQNQHLGASLRRFHRVAQDTPERLGRAAEAAERRGLAFGVKLVRGAYLEKERELARRAGTPDPTQPDYEATSRSYSRCLELMLGQVSRRGPQCRLMVASHNEQSVSQAARRMAELGIRPDGPVCFGQLLGMCDQVSLALGQAGYAVYKSIPYGPLDEVLPYLSRRAQENRAVLHGARRERQLLRRELWRRMTRRP